MAVCPHPVIIRAAQEGDPSAFGKVARYAQPRIARQLMRYPVSDEDRRDLLQSTLLRLFRKIGSFRGEASFATWLFRVTANEALMFMRSNRRIREQVVQDDMVDVAALEGEGSGDDGVESAERVERAARVREALDEIPVPSKDLVIAHYHLDLGLEQIAARLNISESAVRSRLHRARARLRAKLQQECFI